MGNDKNDVVILQLDRPRELRLGHKALKRFSALTGCAMSEMEKEIQHYDKMTCLLYVMLSQEDPELTPEKVDDLLDEVPIVKLANACSAAIEAAFKDEEAETESGDPLRAAGTGTEA